MTRLPSSEPTPPRHGDRYLDRVTAGTGGASTHVEGHFMASDSVRDLVIGMSDGLTVPFALAAGLSGAIAASRLVVTAGLAEVVAGSIAMGLGGYLAARAARQSITPVRCAANNWKCKRSPRPSSWRYARYSSASVSRWKRVSTSHAH